MNMKVHIIAPYESMVPIIKECISLFPELTINYSVGDLTTGAEMARSEEKKGTDVIISRGGTAQLIKKAVKIPVIDMHLSGYDMIRSLTLISNLTDKTAIVGFSNITSGAKSIIELLDYPLNVFTVSDSNEVAPLILKLKNLGYQQIVGDVITVKTSAAYGLKGFLIQSGKESIIKSIEDAKLIYGYLNHKNNLAKIFEQFILKDTKNMIILDDSNQILYEHLTDFPSNPLSKGQLYMLNTDLMMNKSTVQTHFTFDDYNIHVSGSSYQMNDLHYKIYVLEKSSIDLFEQKGLIKHTDSISEPIAISSKAMATILNHLKALYEKNAPILLQGEKGTGKDFITNYIHGELSNERILITIDFEEFTINQLEKLPLSKIGTIKVKNLATVIQHEKVARFIKDCIEWKTRIFIISETPFANEMILGTKMNKILLPNLSERKEDIDKLSQFFLSYYHQNYGTTAIKIKSDALKCLEEYHYPNNIDDLKNVIKQIALNEKDYVIHKETIQRVLSNEKTATNLIIPPIGTLKEIEKEIILAILKEENNNQSKAAERLGINRATLWRKLKE
ncbi:PrpR N-terminal domain-containing protein [Neobacillus niacini]|uniref:sigma-54-dependent transcriptional regulator n=1 Tax=Neobacillus niacini TaxID=86668 RepID=UPI002FFFC332